MSNTKQRALILDIVKNYDGHLSADQIFTIAKRSMPGIVLATVYNNLNALYKSGEIGKVHSEGNTVLFDRSPIRHAHILCDGCGKVVDAPLQGLTPFLKKQIKVEFSEYDLNIHSFCENCKQC